MSADSQVLILSLNCVPRCSIAPIFTVSCVSGENLNLLRKFLNAVPPTRTPPELHQQAPEFHVDEIFNVPEAGRVLGGILTKGMVREGDQVVVGPREDGTFAKTSIATLRRNRTPCRVARAGEAVTVTLTSIERTDVRKVQMTAMSVVKPLSSFISLGVSPQLSENTKMTYITILFWT